MNDFFSKTESGFESRGGIFVTKLFLHEYSQGDCGPSFENERLRLKHRGLMKMKFSEVKFCVWLHRLSSITERAIAYPGLHQ